MFLWLPLTDFLFLPKFLLECMSCFLNIFFFPALCHLEHSRKPCSFSQNSSHLRLLHTADTTKDFGSHCRTRCFIEGHIPLSQNVLGISILGLSFEASFLGLQIPSFSAASPEHFFLFMFSKSFSLVTSKQPLITNPLPTVGGVCNFLNSVSLQQKFEATDQRYSPQMDQCYSSALQLSFI